MLRLLSVLYTKLFGWKIDGKIPSELKKAVFVVAPHTSNWDFIVGLGVRTRLSMKARFLGKKELFMFPFGYFFRALGGYPVDRSGNKNMVERVVDIFNNHDSFMVAIAPEGTRKKVERLKSGFYHIAHQAGASLILSKIDYSTRTVTFSEPMVPTGNLSEDMKKIITYFSDAIGKNPESDLRSLKTF